MSPNWTFVLGLTLLEFTQVILTSQCPCFHVCRLGPVTGCSTRGRNGTQSPDPRSVFSGSGRLSPALLCNFIMLGEFKLNTSLTQRPNGNSRFSTCPITHYNNIWAFLKRDTCESPTRWHFFFLSLGDVVSTLFITAHMVKLFGPFCDFKCKQGFHTPLPLFTVAPLRAL